jgi:multidrug efflux pump
MAIAIMGGLIVGTALTLAFVPALYAASFRVLPAEPTADPIASPTAFPA